MTRAVPAGLAIAALLAPIALFPLLLQPELGIMAATACVAAMLAWASPAYPAALSGAGDLPAAFGIALPDNFVAVTAFVWTSAAVAIALSRRRVRLPMAALLSPPVFLSFLLLVVMVARLAPSLSYEYGWVKTQLFIVLNLTAMVVGMLVAQRRRDLRLFLGITVAIAALSALITMSGVIAGVSGALPYRYSASDTQSPIWLGRATGTGILIALWAVVVGRGAWRLAALAVLPLLIVGFFAAGSRGPVVGVVVAAVVLVGLLVVVEGRVRARIPLIIAGGVLGIALAAQIVPTETFDRAASIFLGGDPSQDVSNGRRIIWGLAWRVFLDNPGLGLGTGGFSAVDPIRVYPHNLLLEAAVEWGVLGLILVAAIVAAGAVTVTRGLRRADLGADRAVAALIAALLVFALANAMFSGDITRNSTIWLALGLGVGLLIRPAGAEGSEQARSGAPPGPGAPASASLERWVPAPVTRGRGTGRAPMVRWRVAPVGPPLRGVAPVAPRPTPSAFGDAVLVPSPGLLRRAVAVLAGGHAVAQLIVLGASPVMTRLYDPAEFGAYAAAVALLLILLATTCLLYDQAVALPDAEDVAADLVILALLGTVVVSTLTAVILAVAGDEILAAFDAAALAPYAWLLVVAQLAGGLMLAFTGLAVRRADYRGLASARIRQSAVMVGTQIAVGAAGVGPAGLLLGDAAGRLAAGARLMSDGLRGLREALAATSLSRLRKAASRYRRFPLLATWPSLMNSVALQVPVLLIVALYGAAVGGLFSFGQRLIGAPVALLVRSIGDVYFSEAARLAREDPAGLRPLYRNTVGKLAAIAIPVCALAVPASFLVGPIFGSAWAEAGTYIAILTPMYAVQIVSSPLGSMLSVLERQDLYLLRETIRIVLISGAVVVAARLSLSPVSAVAALSAAGCVSYVAYGALSWYALDRHERKHRAAVDGTGAHA